LHVFTPAISVQGDVLALARITCRWMLFVITCRVRFIQSRLSKDRVTHSEPVSKAVGAVLELYWIYHFFFFFSFSFFLEVQLYMYIYLCNLQSLNCFVMLLLMKRLGTFCLTVSSRKKNCMFLLAQVLLLKFNFEVCPVFRLPYCSNNFLS